LRIRIPSFSKVNLWLEVLGRRADGYHQIRTVLQGLDLHDVVDLELRDEEGVELEVEGHEVPRGADNLVVRAAILFREKTGHRAGLRVRLRKRIPVGAGLGGGSSNAAATLAGVNALAGNILDRNELALMAGLIGSDVPFFLWGGTALGLGRGEEVQRLPDFPSDVAILLVWPGFQISTAHVYQALHAPSWDARGDLTSADPGTTIREFFSTRETGRWGALRNDLEFPVMSLYPELGRLRQLLLECGCGQAMLAGSGSTVFGMGDPSILRKAAERCRDAGWQETFLCRPLSRAEYCRRWAAAGIHLRD
jgi:4-diphosphocytidyl-2-C-methyl-D-erythritol kinase